MNTLSRDEWLKLAIDFIGLNIFHKEGFSVPSAIAISESGKQGETDLTRLGACQGRYDTELKVHKFKVAPSLNDSYLVLKLITHDLVHALVGERCRHGGEFITVARGIGLEGNRAICLPSSKHNGLFTSFLDLHGSIPDTIFELKKKMPEKSRNIKIECHVVTENIKCGYNFRLSSKWLDLGIPSCPIHNITMKRSES